MTRTAYRIPIRNHPRKWSHAASSSTKDNRLHTVADDHSYSYYAYDHTGQRTLKMAGNASLIDQNAWHQSVFVGLNRVTMYPSAYLVLSEHGYIKHYYAGAERVAARIGGGNLNHDTECIVDDGEAIERSNNLFRQCSDMVNNYTVEHRDLEEMNIVNIDNDEMEAMWKFDMKQVPSMMKAEVIPEPWKILDAIEYFSRPNSIVSQGDDDESDVYFYHSDHLGSASWITNGDGMPVQHLQYLPYGEPYINQRVSGYNERFTFTGKERDEETGYSYFSARYLDHEILTSFLSVDRYADKYPFISPYAYCAWNPVRLTDPTGDTICINGQHYTPGMSGDGLDEFAKKTVAALNTIYGTNEGRSLIDKLGNSDNIFTIEEAEKSEFKPFDNKRASLVQLKTDPDCQSEYQRWLDYGLDLNGGSGGTISWNSAGSILPTENGGLVCATTDLAHEMFHALDANQGLLDHREEKGIPRKDWQAVYRENILRGQMGLPLRIHYRKQMTSNGEFVGGRGEMMISEGKPIKPSWY